MSDKKKTEKRTTKKNGTQRAAFNKHAFFR